METIVNRSIELLLVEDSPDDAEFVIEALAEVGFSDRALVLTDGAAAIEFFCTNSNDEKITTLQALKVILLDLNLPKVSGLEVLKYLKSDPNLQPIPVVIFASSKEAQDRGNAYRLGANSYIVKPIDYELLNQTIREVSQYWLRLNLGKGVQKTI